MKKFKSISIVLTALLVVLAGCNQEEEQEEPAAAYESSPEQEEIVNLAEAFINQLNEGDYEQATQNFDETMASQVTAADLEEIWTSLNDQIGNFNDQEYQSVQDAEDFEVVLITGIFNDADVTFQVTFDEEEQIAGFYVQ